MSIVVYCKQCAKKIRVPASAAGKFGRCPRCQEVVNIPSQSESAPPAAEDSPPQPDPGDPEAEPPDSEPAEPAPPMSAAETRTAAPRAVAATPDRRRRTGAMVVQDGPPPAPRRIMVDYSQALQGSKDRPNGGKQAEKPTATRLAPDAKTQWDLGPEAPPDRWPLILCLAVTALVLAAGYGLWRLLNSEDETRPRGKEEPPRTQFQVPEQKDDWHRLRQGLPRPGPTPAREPGKPESGVREAAPDQ